MGTLKYNSNSKLNTKKPLRGYCSVCLEEAIFRATYDCLGEIGKNRITVLTCTRCYASTQYNKNKDNPRNFYGHSMYKEITKKQKVKRFFVRLKYYFTGRPSRPRFDFRILRGK